LYGLKPAGDDGTYLQKVDFTGVLTQPGSSFSLQPSHGSPLDLKLGDDYVTNNQTQTDSVDIDAPVVFVGYGIEAPEYRWNDFKGVDVKGKVVLVIVNEPPSTDPKILQGGEHDLLRPVDLQVRGGRAQRGGGGAHHPSHRFGQLPVAGGAKLLEQRAGVLE